MNHCSCLLNLSSIITTKEYCPYKSFRKIPGQQRKLITTNHFRSFNRPTSCQHVENSVVKLTFVQKLTFSYGARRVLLVSICNMSEDSCIFHKDFSSLQVNILMHFSRLGKTLCKMHNGILLFFSLKKIFESQKKPMYLFRNTYVSFCNLQKISS